MYVDRKEGGRKGVWRVWMKERVREEEVEAESEWRGKRKRVGEWGQGQGQTPMYHTGMGETEFKNVSVFKMREDGRTEAHFPTPVSLRTLYDPQGLLLSFTNPNPNPNSTSSYTLTTYTHTHLLTSSNI